MKKLNQILLIDDSAADNEYHEIVIKETEIAADVKCITDSRKALECWKNGCSGQAATNDPAPDLVFLDINMPALNGFELLDRVRLVPDPKERKKKMKIFMLTNSMNPDDYNRATEKYGDLITGFRIKPLTDTIFIDIVQKHFAN